jgi:hypothetical protein
LDAKTATRLAAMDAGATIGTADGMAAATSAAAAK